MIKLPFVLLFTAVTAIFWGIYGILLHRGTHILGNSSLRAFIGVGIAYFLIAVLVPAVWLGSKKEKGHWSILGTILSLIAGSVGALGALGVILAVAFKGQPIYVMPIVFGGAPVVNTLVTSWINKSFAQIKPMFIVGLILVGFGAVGVLITKPSTKKVDAHAATHSAAESGHSGEANSNEGKEASTKTASETNPIAIAGSILLAVVCWGAYGPVLHIGQSKMGGSRLRPFCCVGIAYFVIAVAVPIMIIMASPDGIVLEYKSIVSGMVWSILAGSAGAIGALGIILAFTYGGKPVFVMPLVFGFAPVINTFTSMIVDGTLDKISLYFFGAMAIGIAGAVTVLIFAPKAKPHGAPKPTAEPALPAQQSANSDVSSSKSQ